MSPELLSDPMRRKRSRVLEVSRMFSASLSEADRLDNRMRALVVATCRCVFNQELLSTEDARHWVKARAFTEKGCRREYQEC